MFIWRRNFYIFHIVFERFQKILSNIILKFRQSYESIWIIWRSLYQFINYYKFLFNLVLSWGSSTWNLADVRQLWNATLSDSVEIWEYVLLTQWPDQARLKLYQISRAVQKQSTTIWQLAAYLQIFKKRTLILSPEIRICGLKDKFLQNLEKSGKL